MPASYTTAVHSVCVYMFVIHDVHVCFSLEKHALMESFNVFVQILISEALEPGFIGLIQKPGGQ